MKPDAYRDFIVQLKANLEADVRIQGLVLLGSTADQSRPPDQWSDHDFFVVTSSGAQETFRTRFDWLPDHESIVLTVRETQHGLKVLYESGHLLEFAVFDLQEISLAKANEYATVFDRGGVEAAMRRIATTAPATDYTAENLRRDMGMFLCLLVVGGGRVARGEVISGQIFIRTYALRHLLNLLTHVLESSDDSLLDNLDPFRRFERVFPQTGVEINQALSGTPIHAALGLLDVYERVLRDTEGFPGAAAETTRRFLLRIQELQA